MIDSPGDTMITINRILAPVDFSECSNKALKYAREMAEKFSAELILLYIVPDMNLIVPDAVMAVPNMGPDMATLQEAAETALAKHIVEQKLQSPKVRGEVRIGSPAHEIVEAATDLKADLVVIGTHGRTGLSHVFLGSVAERIVRLCPSPVLTVRHHE